MTSIAICEVSGLGFTLQDGLSVHTPLMTIHPLFTPTLLDTTLRDINQRGHLHPELLAPGIAALLTTLNMIQHTTPVELNKFVLQIELVYDNAKLFYFYQYIYTLAKPSACPKYHPQSDQRYTNLEMYLVECQKVMSSIIQFTAKDAQSESLAVRNAEVQLSRLMGWETENKELKRPNQKSYSLHTVVNRMAKHVASIQSANKLTLGKKGSLAFIAACKLLEDKDVAEGTLDNMVKYIGKLKQLGLACGYLENQDSSMYKDVQVVLRHVDSLIEAAKMGLDMQDNFDWL